MSITNSPSLTDWFSIIGLGLDIFGGMFLAKGFITKSIDNIIKESGTYFGGNSYMAKSMISQKIEAIIGGIFLSLGFLGQILSYIIRIKNGWGIFAMMVLILLLLGLIMLLVVEARASKIYEKLLKNNIKG